MRKQHKEPNPWVTAPVSDYLSAGELAELQDLQANMSRRRNDGVANHLPPATTGRDVPVTGPFAKRTRRELSAFERHSARRARERDDAIRDQNRAHTMRRERGKTVVAGATLVAMGALALPTARLIDFLSGPAPANAGNQPTDTRPQPAIGPNMKLISPSTHSVGLHRAQDIEIHSVPKN